MKTLKIVAALGILCLPLATLPAPAQAATAHNSQAGGNGNTTNADAPLRKKPRMMRKHSMKRM